MKDCDDFEIRTISGVIEEINIKKDFDAKGLPLYNVTVALVESANAPGKRLLFRNVRNFEMASCSAFYTEVVEIVSIAERGWERCNYHVREEGGSLFSFYCESYVIEKIDAQTA